jgi:hypothetical protein
MRRSFAGSAGEDFVGKFGPDEGLAAVVPAADEPAGGGDKLVDGVEAAAADGLPGMTPKKIATVFS